MNERPPRVSLNSSAFEGRLRRSQSDPQRSQPIQRNFVIQDVTTAVRPQVAMPQLHVEPTVAPTPATVARPEATVQPVIVVPRSFELPVAPAPATLTTTLLARVRLRKLIVKLPKLSNIRRTFTGFNRPQLAMMTMAAIVFMVGMIVSLQAALVNHSATAQVSALSKKVDSQPAASTGASDAAPSVTPPNPKSVRNYFVAPDLAKYIKIPKLGVSARVLQLGIKNSGELAAPTNVFDTGWYTGSAKPGQAGATLIDGHVSSWTTHGVFYGIKNLSAGDAIQIVKGDNSVLTYRVVKTQVYDADKVDMQAAVTPVTQNKSGLNLITCGGHVKKGTNDFDQRLIVFSELVN